MKIKILLLLAVILCAKNVSGSDDYASTHHTEVLESITVPDSLSLGVILIQFSDWETNKDAEGSNGPAPVYEAGKYKFQHFNNMLFSEAIYIESDLHPDNHDVFGSMRDYYLEVSHARPGGNFL